MTVSVWVMISILAIYNLSLHLNHAGSGHPGNIMIKRGMFFSPEGEGSGAVASEEKAAVDTATENTQEGQAAESDEQPEEEAE